MKNGAQILSERRSSEVKILVKLIMLNLLKGEIDVHILGADVRKERNYALAGIFLSFFGLEKYPIKVQLSFSG